MNPDQPGKLVQTDPWSELRRLTRARVALGRAGHSLPTSEVLEFSYAHALARDAVHTALDVESLDRSLVAAGFQTVRVHSAAPDRATYLLRPDLGRQLDPASRTSLQDHPDQGCDVLTVIADGLSSLAVTRHAQPVLEALRAIAPDHLRFGPVVLASQARVALGDAIGDLMRPKIVILLIGERPGLSSPDSLGIYLTFAPKSGRKDSERNCISNIRPEGLSHELAAFKSLWLIRAALQLGLTGVDLKDHSDASLPSEPRHSQNLLRAEPD